MAKANLTNQSLSNLDTLQASACIDALATHPNVPTERMFSWLQDSMTKSAVVKHAYDILNKQQEESMKALNSEKMKALEAVKGDKSKSEEVSKEYQRKAEDLTEEFIRTLTDFFNEQSNVKFTQIPSSDLPDTDLEKEKSIAVGKSPKRLSYKEMIGELFKYGIITWKDTK